MRRAWPGAPTEAGQDGCDFAADTAKVLRFASRGRYFAVFSISVRLIRAEYMRPVPLLKKRLFLNRAHDNIIGRRTLPIFGVELFMELDAFFENNSISLDIISCFDMWKDGNCTKRECMAESKKIIRDYKGENGEYLIALMTYYWCLLSNNMLDMNVKKQLESFSPKQIYDLWGEDGPSVLEVLNKLLLKLPEPSIKKKCTYSKLRWNAGDTYMLFIDENTKQMIGIDGSEVAILIYCLRVVSTKPKKQSILAYVMLHYGALEESVPAILSNSVFLPVRKAAGNQLLYQYYFFDVSKNCPDDQMIFLGNSDNHISIKNEFKTDDHIISGWTDWDLFLNDVAHRYCFLKQLRQDGFIK